MTRTNKKWDQINFKGEIVNGEDSKLNTKEKVELFKNAIFNLNLEFAIDVNLDAKYIKLNNIKLMVSNFTQYQDGRKNSKRIQAQLKQSEKIMYDAKELLLCGLYSYDGNTIICLFLNNKLKVDEKNTTIQGSEIGIEDFSKLLKNNKNVEKKIENATIILFPNIANFLFYFSENFDKNAKINNDWNLKNNSNQNLINDFETIEFKRLKNLSIEHHNFQNEIVYFLRSKNINVSKECLGFIDIHIETELTTFLLEIKTSKSEAFKALGQILVYEYSVLFGQNKSKIMTKNNVKKIIIFSDNVDLNSISHDFKSACEKYQIEIWSYNDLVKFFTNF